MRTISLLQNYPSIITSVNKGRNKVENLTSLNKILFKVHDSLLYYISEISDIRTLL